MSKFSHCRNCAHLLQGNRCLAYPQKIPFRIFTGEILHNQIFQGQISEYVYTPKEKFKVNDLAITKEFRTNRLPESSFENLKLEVFKLFYNDFLHQGLFFKNWEYAKLDFELIRGRGMIFNELFIVFSDVEKVNVEKFKNNEIIDKIITLLNVKGFNLKSDRVIITIKPEKPSRIEFIPKVFQIPYLKSQCQRCIHRNRNRWTKCLAYPNRIPDEIFVGNLPHDKIFPTQKDNYVFEAKEEYNIEGVQNHPTYFLENLKSDIAKLFYDDLYSQGILKNKWDFVKLDFELLDNQDGSIREMYVMYGSRKSNIEKITNSCLKDKTERLLKIQGPYFNASRLILTINFVSNAAVIEFVPS